ncbi:MAG TPA: bifunctional nuclease family protein [Streptosporangiaceae bacterium]|nr:bifunctional nuclease family protein [Streptosporangiaceae bacterium]
MRVSKAVGLQNGDEIFEYIVLEERDGDRRLAIQVGHAEAFALAASLQSLGWNRPTTYEFTGALVRSLGHRVREVRMDRIVDGAYAATVEVEGLQGTALVDARCSDALNLAVIADTPVMASVEMVAEFIGRQGRRFRRGRAAPPRSCRRPDDHPQNEPVAQQLPCAGIDQSEGAS